MGTSRTIYRPCFVSMSNREWKEDQEKKWKTRGNRIDFIRGEKKDMVLRSLIPSREIGKMLRGKGKESEQEEEEQEKRGSFDKGVSVEAEYTFAKAEGEFTRKAVTEGSYTGGVIKNVKEQLALRAGMEEKGSTKKYVVTVGGSQMRRIGEAIEEVGGEVASTWRSYEIKGEWTQEKVEKVKE